MLAMGLFGVGDIIANLQHEETRQTHPLSGHPGVLRHRVYSVSNSEFDVYLMALFGLLGYIFTKLECEPAPMLLGFILGPMMGGVPAPGAPALSRRPLILVQRPLSAILLLASVVLLFTVLLPAFRKTREEAFQE